MFHQRAFFIKFIFVIVTCSSADSFLHGQAMPRKLSVNRAEVSLCKLDGERSHIFGEGVAGHVPTILQVICARRREDVAHAKSIVSLKDLEEAASKFDAEYGPPLDLRLKIDQESADGQMALAAEVVIKLISFRSHVHSYPNL